MTTVEVVLLLRAVGGQPATGQYRVESERAFGYTGSPWVMQMVVKPNTLLSQDGEMRIRLPHTNQVGLVGDNGAALDAEPAYKVSIMPTGSLAFGSSKFFRLPTSLGTGTVNLSSLTDLGGWPNQTTTVVTPPPVGGDFVPVTVLGNPGYWSPT